MKHCLKPHGPRGVMLLGFAAVSLTLGFAYTRPGAGRGLAWLDQVIPVSILGWLWAATGFWLLISGFRIRQSRALAAFSGLCFLWGTAYLIASIINVTHGHPPIGYTLIPVFYGLTIACAAAVRMVNPAPQHVEVVVKPGPKNGGHRG